MEPKTKFTIVNQPVIKKCRSACMDSEQFRILLIYDGFIIHSLND